MMMMMMRGGEEENKKRRRRRQKERERRMDGTGKHSNETQHTQPTTTTNDNPGGKMKGEKQKMLQMFTISRNKQNWACAASAPP